MCSICLVVQDIQTAAGSEVTTQASFAYNNYEQNTVKHFMIFIV